ncbi:MAG: DNA polymerase I [Thermoguttaceae bacterium]
MPDRPRQTSLPGFGPEDENPPALDENPSVEKENHPEDQALTPTLSGHQPKVGRERGEHEQSQPPPSSFILHPSSFPPCATAGLPGSAVQPADAGRSPDSEPRTLNPEPSLIGKSVWVIDGHSLIHQVFHALPEMSSPRGEPVGAVFGFIRDLFFLIEEKKPDYLFCAFDLPGKTFRYAMYDQYKIQRPEMDAELVPQIASIRRVLEVLGIPALGVEGFEADDVLATVARLTDELGGECILVTSDKDCRQLITDRVKVFNIRKNTFIDRDALKEDWGIAPEQVVDYQALVGDAVDNVPGVPLIGPKFARQLLEQFGTLQAVLDHAGEVAGAKRKENLIKYRDQALLSRDLVRLDSHVSVPIPWDVQTGRIDRQAALALFREFGFRSLVLKIDALCNKLGPHPNPLRAPTGTMRSMVGWSGEGSFESGPHPGPLPVGEGTTPTYHLVDTPETFEAFLSELKKRKTISLDTETTNKSPRWAELVGLSFAWDENEAWYLPVRSPPDQRHLDLQTTLSALRPMLENAEIRKIGQNLKYDIIVLRGAGINLAGTAFDTMVASYLLDAGQRNHNLDDLALDYLGHTTIKISELIGSGKNQKRMDEVPVRQVADYAGEDALLPMRLIAILAKKLDENLLSDLFKNVELPLIDVLAEMEYTGVKVDVAQLAELSGEYGRRLQELKREIHALAGHDFNIASPKQLQEVLFTELKLPIVKKTPKTGPSTDAEVLEQLAPLHPLPAKLLEYRQYAKLKSTYVDALPALVHPSTGRVHASFNQVVAATGRLSSSDPNLQNIPVRTEIGREIRSAFIPGEPDWTLLAADYSQIELRILAHFCGDQRLCEAFARDEDIHARVAGQVNNVPLEQVTPKMRREAKAVNFGVIYGQSAFGLARALGIEQEAAARFIDGYFQGYPGIEEFLEQILAECAKTGYVKTILGRRRAIQGVRPNAGRQRNLAERTAINTVIQGSAADLIKLAMIAIHRRLKSEGLPARMLLQIHDELIFEVPSQKLSTLAALVSDEMAGVWNLKVPLKVDLKAGPNWADAEKL